jgi:hypothetical protein
MQPVNFKGVHNGHEQTYNWVRQFLRDLDFNDAATRLGFTLVSGDELAIDFLGRTYKIDREHVALLSERVAWKSVKTESSHVLDFNLRSILAYYAISQGNCEPKNIFAPLTSFSHGIFGSPGSALDQKRDPLSRMFGDDYAKFERAAALLNSPANPFVFEKKLGDGKYVWRYALLPKVPINIAYYEGDDEFPTAIKILFDETALQFFKFEPLAVLNGCFAEALAAVGASIA